MIASRLWGRTAFYQSSGAYGFRDQLQDVMALVHAAPGWSASTCCARHRASSVEGDVQHWWHPPSGKGVRTRCSDDYLWLPLATCRYVETTGDVGVLDQACPFLESRPLKDGEAVELRATDSVGGRPRASTSTACARSATACDTGRMACH